MCFVFDCGLFHGFQRDKSRVVKCGLIKKLSLYILVGNTGYDHATLTQNKLPSGGQETNNNMVAMAGGHHGYDRGYTATSTATAYPDLQTGECKEATND